MNVLPLSAVTGVITDAGIGEASLEALRETGLQVIVAD